SGDLIVDVTNTGNPRRLSLTGTTGSSAGAPAGSYVLARPLDPAASRISASLAPGDAWPENDQAAALVPPSQQRQKWWVGTSPPAGDWRIFTAAQLPTDSSAYLAASVIVL